MGLSLKLRHGEDFYVEDTRVVIKSVHVDSSFTIQAEGGEPMHVGQDFAVELFPGVMVSASQNPEPNVAKIIIEAPRSISVVLGSLYRNPKPKALDDYLYGQNALEASRSDF